MSTSLRVVALIPAYNEEASIAATIRAMLCQERVPDRIVVIPNGCSDGTAEVARQFPVTVLELPKLPHKKSEALNTAWRQYARNADLVICLDADTVMPPNAVRDWEAEFLSDASRGVVPRPIWAAKNVNWEAVEQPAQRVASVKEQPKLRGVRALPLGGSSSKFTMIGTDFLTRLQRAEFSRWTDTALRRGWTSVLAGTGAAISGEALRQVAARDDREGPWAYTSQVEDFELTYRIRELGYRCQVSPTVRAYTDSMKTLKALWGQRMKWQVGTIEDLLHIGVNRLTLLDWFQQFSGMFSAFARYLWVAVIVALCLVGDLHFQWLWWVILPLFFVAVQVKHALRIPHRDSKDLAYAFLIYPSEAFAWLRAAWFTAAWIQAPIAFLRGKRKDRWNAQYSAEAFRRGLLGKLRLTGLRAVALGLVATLAILAVGNLYPRSGMPTVEGVARLGPDAFDHSTPVTCKGYVALTYDDGPTKFTADTSDALARYGLHAAFFLTGEHIVQNPDAVRALQADGHQIGNHSNTHPHLPKLPAAAWQDEIVQNDDIIASTIGEMPTLFRPPYGETNDEIRKFADGQGLVQTLWTLDTNDWAGKTASQVDDVIGQAKGGDIILMHDDEDTDIKTVPLIAATLRRLGLCTGMVVADTKTHHIDLLDKDEAVKVVSWEGR
jgi:peptidoglycan/xylan/chitin deacetylase (PgdA/CDA1 family)/cellulose synthase/poly-beta-1,6-N-acetylglucosamine synthase-like glycosyltransferase